VASDHFVGFDPARVPSPCYVVDEVALEDNLRLLARVQSDSGAKVLLALKAFSMFAVAPLVRRYLSGTCASGLYEARLGREEFGGEVHTFCAAYRDADFDEVLTYSDHLVFNSVHQWHHFRERCLGARERRPQLRFGLRINPRHSEGATPLYDPCAPGSRLGITPDELAGADLDGISGLHFHTLCEQDLPPLARTLAAVEAQFGPWLERLEWINFGGGHHVTRAGYQVEALIELIRDFRARRGLAVYLEPGEAVALETGVLVAEVLDLKRNERDLAILDTSATCHMPDVLEMPYRPRILGAAEPGALPHSYRLGGQTCLAGDVIGDYAFAAPLQRGQRLLFADMAHYTMVKTNTFNGVPLPAIAIWNSETDALRIVRQFDYQDFRNRLS
jgi:carboxynorspermidine decarboxylase